MTPSASEERIGTVLELIEQSENGRLGQQQIAIVSGYSRGSVSVIVRELDDRGAVEVIDLGRSNLVCLPDRVPEAAKPPEAHR